MTTLSHTVLRGVIAVISVALAVLSAVVGPLGSVVAALILIALTPFVVLDPGSRLTALLVGLHGMNWLSSNPVPDGSRAWTLTILVALGLLAIHLAASMTSALPKAAPVPRASLVRWFRRTIGVVGLSVPVWALLISQSTSRPAGDALITYAAVAALAVLALAFWLAHMDSPGGQRTR